MERTGNGYSEELNGSHYKQGIEAIEHRWEKCIELTGDYVEEIRYFSCYPVESTKTIACVHWNILMSAPTFAARAERVLLVGGGGGGEASNTSIN